MGRSVHPRTRNVVLAALVLAALVLTGACSGQAETMSDGDASSGGQQAPAAQEAPAEEGYLPGRDAAGDADEAAPDSEAGAANRTTVQTRAVIRRGEISLLTREMNRARTEIDDLLSRLGGFIASEDTVNDRTGRPERSVLVLRVPEPSFDEAMSRLADIGRAQRTDRSSEDVTTQVIDIDSRVASQEASLARLRGFLRQAEDVDTMVRIESEIASRQAQLESLKAQQKYLRDQTAMATVTVRLRTPDTPPPTPDDESGFLAGLADGWAALTSVLVVGATVAGAILPFLAAAALFGVPVWLLLRAARRRRPAPSTDPAPDAG